MKWIVDNDRVEDEFYNVVAFLPEGTSRKTKKLIEKAPEMYAAILNYIQSADDGSLPARKMYKNFETVLSDIPKEEL